MPTTYAHYTFGKEVLKYLDDEIREIIAENIELYNIGVHGPDILFYYGPLKSNRINKIGNEIHGKKAAYFFENAKKLFANALILKLPAHTLWDSYVILCWTANAIHISGRRKKLYHMVKLKQNSTEL